MGVEVIFKYFPDLSARQKEQFAQLGPLYEEWNSQINVISRKDMENFYVHHVLHSLAILKIVKPADGSRILDLGTGGGFPGIPMAIMLPQSNFVLADSIAKKIKVVQEVAAALELPNVEAVHKRAEDITGKFDLVVSRAVARLNVLVRYCHHSKMRSRELLCLKGGDLTEELEEVERFAHMTYPISSFFEDPFFETKQVVRIQF